MSHSAIVTCTGLPLGTVKSHLRRAQARLRQALGDDAFGPPNRNPRPDHDHDPAP
jgi:DNA-directed RNA polymerase specialized sigma24 family protein